MNREKQKIALQEILEGIAQADQDQITRIIRAINQWYSVSYPDWDVVYIALPKDPKKRRVSMDGIRERFEKELQWYEEKLNKMDSLE